jgi:autotransporter-associated beta strand protein
MNNRSFPATLVSVKTSRVHSGASRSATGCFALAVACAAVLSKQSAHSATLYWDGTGTGWDSVGSWSDLDNGDLPDPLAVPGAADIATFVSSTALTAQTVNLNTNQSALGLATNLSNTFLTTIRGGGTNRTLNLGTSGITHTGGAITIGSATAGQQVAISLQGAQTWDSSTSGTGAIAIMVLNGVSIGAGGNQTLNLAGSNTGSRISGVVSDGAGILSITKTGTPASIWTLSGANAYTGITTVTGGTLRIDNNLGLGSTVGGTSVENNAGLQLTNNITITGESLSLVGNGIATNTGALRNLSGNNTWAGPITILPGATTRVNSDAGSLTISGNITLSATISDQFVLQGAGNGEISGVISGPSRVTRGGIGAGMWVLSGANTYTGRTVITNGTVSVSSLNRVSGGTASSNLGAPTTVANGTIDLGGGTTSGTLRYTGTGETTDRAIHLPGTTGGGVIDQSGTGILEFTGNVTAAVTGKTLTLQGSSAGTGRYTGVIGGAVSVTKAGTGTWTLTGANTYTGTTNTNGGTLIVDLSTNTSGVLPATTTLTTGNGILNIQGASSGTSNQAVASLSTGAGAGRIIINPNGGSNTTLAIASPVVTNTVNSRLVFDYTLGTTNGTAIGNNAVAWAADLSNGLIGPNYFVVDSGGFGFATVSAGNVVRLVPTLGLPQSGASSSENYLLSGNTPSTTPGSLNLAQTASQTINTLTVNTAATSGTVTLGNTTLSVNAILVTGSTANTFSIAGSGSSGVQTPNAGGNLTIEHNAAGAFTISAPILDNTASTLVNNGVGITVLSGANTYTGATILNAGTTRFSGTMAGSPVTINGTAIAQFGSATGLSSLNSITFGPSTGGRLQTNGNNGAIGMIVTDANPGTPIIENASANPGTLTVSPVTNLAYPGVFQDGAGGGTLGLTLAPADLLGTPAVLALTGPAANTNTGLTTITGTGIVDLNKPAGINSIGGNLAISNGGKLRFVQSNQIADNATVTISGAGSSFNGTAVNVAAIALNETFANLTMTGGAFTTGTGATGFNVTGATNITGGVDGTIFLGNSGSQFATNSLSLTDMPAIPGGVVATPNSFAIYGNSTTVRSRLSIGSGGLLLNGSFLNLRRGNAGAMGSRLVLDGDVSTTGAAPSSINLDSAGGTTGAVSVDLSSTPGTVERFFNVGDFGADLSVSVPLVNGAATTASITKVGPGVLTLSAVNTYNGSTNVRSGTVIISGASSGSAAIVGNSASPAVSAALMGGNGSVSTTPTVSDISAITAGAIVAPGISNVSTGVLNTNTFSLTNSAHLSIQIGGIFPGGNGFDGYDRINVLSPATSASVSGGILDLIDLSIFPPPTDALLFILVNNGTDAPSSLFSGVTLGANPVANINNIVIGGQQFALVNNADFDGVTGLYGGSPTGGNDIALVAVPEPVSAISVLVGSALIGLRRRRKV